MNYIKGDFIRYLKYAPIDVALHNCNCQNTMGAGIAKLIANEFQAVSEVDRATVKGDKSKLGTSTSVMLKRGLLEPVTFYNVYGQFNYSRTAPQFDLEAFIQGFTEVAIAHSGKRILMPKVGAGLGGGDWEVISKRLSQVEQQYELTLFVVEYDPTIPHYIVAGSRSFGRNPIVENAFKYYLSELYATTPFVVISGTAAGPDKWGEEWAIACNQLPLRFPADWSLGKGAGYIRNGIMNKEGDGGIVLYDGHSRGTKQMLELLYKAEKQLYTMIIKTRHRVKEIRDV